MIRSESENPAVVQLSLCGQIAEQKSRALRADGIDEAFILSALSDEEKAELSALLQKLQVQWAKEYAERAKRFAPKQSAGRYPV